MTLDSLTLAAGGSRVEIVPALGGRIASLRLGGREWLWRSAALPSNVSSTVLADAGGYDEFLPTVGATRLPDEVPGYGGLTLADRGDLWSQHAATERLDARAATTRWTGGRMPYAFARTVRVAEDGTVEMAYALTNDGAVPMPFLWSSHALLPLAPDTRLVLPIAARVRVATQHGIDLGGERAEHRWPLVRASGVETDFAQPATVRGAAGRWACTLFLDLPTTRDGRARLAVEQGDARLEVALATRDVPHLALWLNHRGGTPLDGGAPHRHLAFAPCIGAPDRLDAALGAWRSAAWLAPRETRTWTLAWRGRRRPG